MPGTAIVIGATGLVGTQLTLALLKDGAYDHVRTVGRKPFPLSDPKLENVVIDMADDNALREALQGDVLFCCIGTTIKKAGSQAAFRAVDFDIPLRAATLSRENKVRQFHLISAIGARAASSNFYLRTKGEVEEALMKTGFPSLFIYRPSFLMGDRKEVRFGEQAALLLSPLMKLFLHGSLRKYRPVKAATVAQAMIGNAKRGTQGVIVMEGFPD
ncbi:NAD(P)H-binding protein [Chitinophaga lutea]